jgi:SAM-dependent methyltransferase
MPGGADPKVDYLFEIEHSSESIRIYEWKGIVKAVSAIRNSRGHALDQNTNWLDFGCGTGGMVKWVQEHIQCRVMGYEEGFAAELTRRQNLPILSHQMLQSYKGYFDVVTAIEVLEHVVDPLETLRLIRSCLKPGGIFFFTTGNAERFRNNILGWSYVIPEIHVSFFEPRTIEKAFGLSGFKPLYNKIDGFEDIITFKILKNLGFKKYSRFYNLLPWKILANIADSLYKVTAFPIGEAI